MVHFELSVPSDKQLNVGESEGKEERGRGGGGGGWRGGGG